MGEISTVLSGVSGLCDRCRKTLLTLCWLSHNQNSSLKGKKVNKLTNTFTVCCLFCRVKTDNYLAKAGFIALI